MPSDPVRSPDTEPVEVDDVDLRVAVRAIQRLPEQNAVEWLRACFVVSHRPILPEEAEKLLYPFGRGSDA